MSNDIRSCDVPIPRRVYVTRRVLQDTDKIDLYLDDLAVITRYSAPGLWFDLVPVPPIIMVSPTGLKRSANHLSTPAIDSKKPKSNGSITSFFGIPKAKSTDSNPVAPSSSFNKEKWVASLTQDQRELLQLEIDTLDDSWLAQLRDEVVSPEFLGLKRFLKKEMQSGAKIFPPENEIYSWCVRESVKSNLAC